MIDWIKTAQGLAVIIAAIFATMAAWWSANPLYQSCRPEMDAVFVMSRGTAGRTIVQLAVDDWALGRLPAFRRRAGLTRGRGRCSADAD